MMQQDNIKVVTLSPIPLPYAKIGSWSTLYRNYINDGHQIDIIICPEPQQCFEGIEYHIIKPFKKWKAKLLGRFQNVFDALKFMSPDDKYVIQIIDHVGVVIPLQNFLLQKKIRDNCYIQYFYHGFPPLIDAARSDSFFSSIDEIVFLTNASHEVHRKNYARLPEKVSVMYNGIDTAKFFPPDALLKKTAREKLGIDTKTVFIWCSQDRPKKGLDLLLSAWDSLYRPERNILLLVVGCEPRNPLPGVRFAGKIPNDELPVYFQVSDVMLFPTLCEEGFGMSLIEALHCGCYCIASALGGVPEVLQYGKLGKLIEKPSEQGEWVRAIEDYISNPVVSPAIEADLYTSQNWNLQMNKLIHDAKNTIETI